MHFDSTVDDHWQEAILWMNWNFKKMKISGLISMNVTVNLNSTGCLTVERKTQTILSRVRLSLRFWQNFAFNSACEWKNKLSYNINCFFFMLFITIWAVSDTFTVWFVRSDISDVSLSLGSDSLGSMSLFIMFSYYFRDVYRLRPMDWFITWHHTAHHYYGCGF